MIWSGFDRANAPITADLARLTAERDTLTTEEPTGPVQVQDAANVGTQWDDAEAPERRGMLIAALGSLYLVLDPAPKNGPQVLNPARVRIADPQTTLTPAGCVVGVDRHYGQAFSPGERGRRGVR
ncbi:MAG: hypothetical protein ACRDTE_16280 [Pseudonocardiaceae bacterium]